MVLIPRVTGTSLCVQNAFIKFIIDFKRCIGAKYFSQLQKIISAFTLV